MADSRLNLTQAAKAAGVTRRTLYNHINQGKVTTSRDEKNNPVIDVSELIRVYGNVSLPVKKIPAVSQRKNIRENFTPDALETLRTELADLRQAVTLMLDDKTAREDERRRGEEERRQLQEEVRRLGEELQTKRTADSGRGSFPGVKNSRGKGSFSAFWGCAVAGAAVPAVSAAAHVHKPVADAPRTGPSRAGTLPAQAPYLIA